MLRMHHRSRPGRYRLTKCGLFAELAFDSQVRQPARSVGPDASLQRANEPGRCRVEPLRVSRSISAGFMPARRCPSRRRRCSCGTAHQATPERPRSDRCGQGPPPHECGAGGESPFWNEARVCRSEPEANPPGRWAGRLVRNLCSLDRPPGRTMQPSCRPHVAGAQRQQIGALPQAPKTAACSCRAWLPPPVSTMRGGLARWPLHLAPGPAGIPLPPQPGPDRGRDRSNEDRSPR
jgi:hypothetical protein